MMKKLKWISIGLSLVTLVCIMHWFVRPSIVVTFDGNSLSNEEVIIFRGNIEERVRLDENGKTYLNYRDIGNAIYISRSKNISGVVESNLISVEAGGNKAPLIRNTATVYETAILKAKADRDLEKQMEQIIFANVAFTEDTTLRHALNFVALRLRDSDPPSPLSAKLVKWRKNLPVDIQEKNIGLLGLKNVYVAEVLDVIFLRCGYTWQIINGDLAVEEVRKEGNVEIHLKLDRVKIQKVEFIGKNALRLGINFIRLRARDLDTEVPVSQRGVGFVFMNKSFEAADIQETEEIDEDYFHETNRLQDKEIDDLMMYHVSIREALTLVCRRGGLKWYVGKYKVILSNRED